MKNIFILIIAMSLLAGCQPQGGNTVLASQSTGREIGCQIGEISLDGGCEPAVDKKNVGLFGQDLDQYVETEMVSDGVTGFVARPRAPGSYPGVVMIHEWWGLNDNVKEMAKILAKEGYVVFAIDLYDGKVARDSATAGQLASSVRDNPQDAVLKMKAAVKYLKETEGVGKVASLGWCFGGGQSLVLSLNEDIDATVIYYGTLVNDSAQLKMLKGPILGIFGENDTSIPVSSVYSFESALDSIGKKNDIYVYSGVGHAFANPSGSSYAPNETVDAWQKTVAFLESSLKQDSISEDNTKEDRTSEDNAKKNSTQAMTNTTNTTDSADTAGLKTFMLTGSNFRFMMGGVESPVLKVKKGDTVRIELTSNGSLHDWVVDEFDAKTRRLTAGQTDSVEFVADKSGTFEYYCSVGSHRGMGMKGSLIVE